MTPGISNQDAGVVIARDQAGMRLIERQMLTPWFESQLVILFLIKNNFIKLLRN